jgi:hypothetical protein
MTKNRLRHVHNVLRPISTWMFLVVAISALVYGTFQLRHNNLRSIELRQKVLQADKEDGDVESALKELREHMHSHMNSGLANDTGLQQPIQLKYRYERLLEAEKQRVAQNNEKIYQDAQAYCEGRFGGASLRDARVPCTQEYISNRGINEEPIPEELYKFNFASPVWSADRAGISLRIGSLAISLFVIRFLLERWFNKQLNE